jgi:hypothetical protein
MPKLELDAQGNVTTPGRFQGRHIDEVVTYLEGLEAAVTQQVTAPEVQPAPSPQGAGQQPGQQSTAQSGQAPNPAQPTDAASRLAAATQRRMDPFQAMTLQRLEQDDEAAFAGQVADYEQYREQINKLKDTLAPEIRAQRNLHRTLYINVKSNDERVRQRLYEPIQTPDGEAGGDGAAPTTVEGQQVAAGRPADAAPGGAAPRVEPRPAPPMARPTPAARSVQPPPKKAKLVATEKVKAFCRQTGQNVEEYLLRLEANGVTQSEMDNAGQLGRSASRPHVYDRKRAGA